MIEIPAHIKGLVFDCDGTIADTMPLHYRAWVEALRERECDFPEAFFYECAGMPTRTIIELLNDKHGLSMNVEETFHRKENLYLKLLPQVVAIEPVLKCIMEYGGKLPMAVATGATRAICEKTLNAIGLLGRFVDIAASDDVKHGKPAPDVFLVAAKKIGIAPELCCAFEDADLGVQSARAAEMHVIDVRHFV